MLEFDPVHPSFDGALQVDFTRLVPSGATLSTGTVTCAVHPLSAAADANASTRVYGAVAVTGAKLAREFTGGVDEVDYILTFTPTFSDGTIDPVEVFLPVRKDAA